MNYGTEYEDLLWRVGRKVGRTIYAVINNAPSDDDVLIGVMDTPELAAHLVGLHNAYVNAPTPKTSGQVPGEGKAKPLPPDWRPLENLKEVTEHILNRYRRTSISAPLVSCERLQRAHYPHTHISPGERDIQDCVNPVILVQ